MSITVEPLPPLFLSPPPFIPEEGCCPFVGTLDDEGGPLLLLLELPLGGGPTEGEIIDGGGPLVGDSPLVAKKGATEGP